MDPAKPSAGASRPRPWGIGGGERRPTRRLEDVVPPPWAAAPVSAVPWTAAPGAPPRRGAPCRWPSTPLRPCVAAYGWAAAERPNPRQPLASGDGAMPPRSARRRGAWRRRRLGTAAPRAGDRRGRAAPGVAPTASGERDRRGGRRAEEKVGEAGSGRSRGADVNIWAVKCGAEARFQRKL